jgi:hypothetical protein
MTVESFSRMTVSTAWVTAGLVSPIVATRRAISACCSAGNSRRTCAARRLWRFASTSAIACGDSLRRKTCSWSAGVRRRNSNGRRSMTADRRAMMSAARSGPTERSSTSRANSTPPSAR